MPCTCWYDPPEASQKLIKSLCQQLISEIQRLEKDGDPVGATLWDIKKLLDHLYSGQCNEKPKADVIAEEVEEWDDSLRCITKDGRNVNITEEINRINKLKKEKNEEFSRTYLSNYKPFFMYKQH